MDDRSYYSDEHDSYQEEESLSDLEGDDNNNSNVSVLSYSLNDNNSAKNDERAQSFRKLFSKLSLVYPGSFRSKESILPYYSALARGGEDSQVPLLILKPVLTGSWLDPPDKRSPGDSQSYWQDIHNTYPRRSRLVPPKFSLAAKARCSYTTFDDPALKSFLKGPAFKRVHLDHTIFDKASVEVGSSPPSHIDYMLRAALLDSFTNDEFFRIIFGIVHSLKDHASSTTMSNTLDLLISTLEVTAENNQRIGQTILASLVQNKLALRDLVLRKFRVHPLSRALLRGSDFKSDALFGPLPDSFQETLLHPSGNGFKCLSRDTAPTPSTSRGSTSGRTYPQKRTGPSGARSSAKRSRPSSSTAPQQQFFRPKTRKRK